ncbi:Ankyrin repeat and EF-hand domain-containing protein 1 [Phytophthora pseudosyringae]|uniref:Ankyrin repeat and EF-hand domain-containing protein 1 n=1 Tax=Phytophthora pseudosyringae TaxID=221518 RepID=A0A8T1VD67_9STRA|nr:Ankyrin repeat and EF-hand domain-containing protein 1 [Phytophthora pseudosyringae]
MQSNLAPSVTPRPVKPGAAAARGGRTYLLSASPIKLASGNADAKALAVIRPAESPIPPTLRKKPLILSGDIRNLGSNFQLATARGSLSLTLLGDVLAAHGIVITRAEAQALRHEFEENNDRGLSYASFVDELARSLRGPATGTADADCPNESGGAASRALAKKPRLAEHLSRLSTRHTQLVGEVRALLGANLRVPWTAVRDACRAAETGAGGTGRLPKSTFARVLTGLQIPSLSPAALEELSQDGTCIEYHEFLAQFGSSFLHGDTNNVGNSLVFDRPTGKPIAEVATGTGANNVTATNKTLQSPGVTSVLGGHSPSKKKSADKLSEAGKDPVLLEQLRIVVGERLKARSGEIMDTMGALDPSDSGVIPAPVFTQALRDLRLVESEEETATVLYVALDGSTSGSVDYRKFVTSFGDETLPRGLAAMKRSLQENSSLIFAGGKEVKGAHKNRVALSSPGNELKEAFSRLPDASWRAIHVELELSDPRKGGLVPAAELLRVLSKHLGPLPSRHFGSLFRACGSHAHQLMDYKSLVKSYRPRVADTESFFASPLQGEGAREAVAVGRQHSQQATAPTESLVLVWSVRVARARLGAVEWRALQDRLAACDPRRQGRVATAAFALAVRDALSLTEAQTAFLCYFYEDRSIATDAPLIRYASFLTDYEDPGLEANDSNDPEDCNARVSSRAAGAAAMTSGGPSLVDTELGLNTELELLRQFLRANVGELEAMLAAEDSDRRGFVSLPVFTRMCAKLSSEAGSKWRETRATAKLFARYIARGGQFYYRGFLLDMDGKAGLQAQALVLQEDDEDDEARDSFTMGSIPKDKPLDVHEARAAIRHHLTCSRSQQSAVYKLLANMDPSGSGLLTYPELRRAFERLGIHLRDDAVAQELLNFYEEEDPRGERTTGKVKYLQLLHALGGRDPDKVGRDSSMSDLSSHCSYYSSVGISPRAVRRSQAGIVASRQLTSRAGHVLAAQAVNHAVENPRASLNAGIGATGGAGAVEQKLQKALQAQGKTAWKQLARKLQALDNERRGSVTPSSLRKVLGELGIELDQEEIVRLQLKYDAEQNGRLNYHALLRQLTSALSDLGAGSSATGTGDLLPSLSLTSPTKKNKPRGSENVPEDLRLGVQAKWKEVYASLKTLDKSNSSRVSAAHFRQLLEWYALPITDTSFLAVLRAFDSDDGLVDYNSFMRSCFRG